MTSWDLNSVIFDVVELYLKIFANLDRSIIIQLVVDFFMSPLGRSWNICSQLKDMRVVRRLAA